MLCLSRVGLGLGPVAEADLVHRGVRLVLRLSRVGLGLGPIAEAALVH